MTDTVFTRARGRTSPQEVRRELEDLFSLIVRQTAEADEHAAGETRAVLDEMSRSRARDGFSPSETRAVGVHAVGRHARFCADPVRHGEAA
jgi:rsbT co-antagonist protein RsbR